MDELDHLLTPTSLPSQDDEAAWQCTRGVLRRRRWTRRGGVVAVMAICFVTGALAFRWTPAPPRQQEIAKHDEPEKVVTPKSPVDPYLNSPPDRIERWAHISQGDRAIELYRRAGDGYLSRGDDLAALRCYRHALDGGGPSELVVREQDTWLLMSLKLSRQKERKNAIPQMDGGAGTVPGIDRAGAKSA